MALTPRQAATLFLGTSLFGLLTFTSGLMIGVGMGGTRPASGLPIAPPAPIARGAPAATPAPAPAPTGSQQALATPATGGGVVVLPMPKAAPAGAQAALAPAAAAVPGATPAGSAAAATASAPSPTAAGATAAAAPAGPPPLAVKDFRVGLPLDLAPLSPLRGKLVDATLAAPRALVVAPATPAAAPVPGSAAAAVPVGLQAAPAMAGPPSPFVFSVQAGSFLLKANADRLAEELNKRGYAAQVLVAQSPGEPAWYPVVLAPVTDAALVARLAQEFSASEGHQAEIVSWLAAK